MRELLNYKKAFDFVSEYLETGGPITEGLVRGIHKRLVKGVRGGAADPGEYQKIRNYVVNSVTGERVYTPPPAHVVNASLQKAGLGTPKGPLQSIDQKLISAKLLPLGTFSWSR